MAKTKSGGKGGIAALDQSPSHLLHRALQRALDVYAEAFGEGAITQRQFAVLAAAEERPGATQADLVRITGIDRSTLAELARRMIGKGLLVRERSSIDARANAVRLTDSGREVLAQAWPKMVAADTKLLKLISGNGRRATFVRLLRDIAKARAAEVPAPPQAPQDMGENPVRSEKAVKGEKTARSEKTFKRGKKAKKKTAGA